jgi:hypothetical protein
MNPNHNNDVRTRRYIGPPLSNGDVFILIGKRKKKHFHFAHMNRAKFQLSITSQKKNP